jgi:hypothetical protein
VTTATLTKGDPELLKDSGRRDNRRGVQSAMRPSNRGSAVGDLLTIYTSGLIAFLHAVENGLPYFTKKSLCGVPRRSEVAS